MAREYGRLWLSIWSDPDFAQLDITTQWLYLALLSQPGMTTCGVQPFTPNRWAGLTPGLSVRQVDRAIGALTYAKFVVVDRATDELAIRSHLRYDQPLRIPNTAKAVARTVGLIRSETVRAAVVAEMQRLYDEGEHDDWKGWGVPEIKALIVADPKVVW